MSNKSLFDSDVSTFFKAALLRSNQSQKLQLNNALKNKSRKFQRPAKIKWLVILRFNGKNKETHDWPRKGLDPGALKKIKIKT
jgi:hypothetical protein